ncbi:unnamed protein product [Cuscuta epithymum]|uniref:F-box domain-containing protein n=1 Tax=Cuscuta epithymum TaxID=186058 RepID=A0AAV0F058_9ASTE|nr:unnamed protein product [Cuscuta epithymum]
MERLFQQDDHARQRIRFPNPNLFFQLSLLPQDILFEILIRLGAKSRGKLCCVSKSFRSIITGPSFVEFHRNWSTASDRGTTILFSISAPVDTPKSDDFTDKSAWFKYCSPPEEFYTINYKSHQGNQPLEAKRVRHMDKVGNFSEFRYGSSAGDLICLSDCLDGGKGVICNLRSGQQTALLTTTPDWAVYQTNAFVLLGFDSSSATYKVLKSEFGDPTVKHWVLTLGVDATWREINSSAQFYPGCHYNTSVCINGVLYFYNGRRTKAAVRDFPIVAFDLRSETFRLIALPQAKSVMEAMEQGDMAKSSFVELDGRFTVIRIFQNMLITWSLDMVANLAACWKKHNFLLPFELHGPFQVAGSKTFCTLTTIPTGEIVVLTRTGETCSVWVLFDKFGPEGLIWKKFGINGLGDFPNYDVQAFKAVMVQNLAENVLHPE